ncbi:uncharacterized protein LOC105261655 [Musca domestica]|uniref:Uncharacterized protein LOC105261655 n=1 Tax=Musca domestica TaxID=7370 RepID=A0A9J7D6L4_MUSDO|nr:uncharacterized protein LOC105261655 [Musca domestica]
MFNSITKLAIVAAALIATTIHETTADDASGLAAQDKFLPERVFDHYGLGREVRGAYIMITYQYNFAYSRPQKEVYLNYAYNDPQANKITQILLLVETDEGGTSAAFVTAGGINQSSIGLRVVGYNTARLRYMVIVFGVKA